MIESKRINIIVAVAVIFALITSIALVILGNLQDGTYNYSSEAEYVTEIFGTDIISIEIIADEDDWQQMLDNASSEQYIMVDVIVNGTKFENVGIRPKGNSSLKQVVMTDSDRYSFRIKFDEYIDGQTCFGLESFVVNNMYGDNTYMKEYVSYDLMKEIGVEAPYFGFADIKVNGENWGLYLAVELYNDSYEQRVFGDTEGMLYSVKRTEMEENQPMQPGGNISIMPGEQEGNTRRPEGQPNPPNISEEQDSNITRSEGQQNAATMPEEQAGNVTRPGGQQNAAAMPREQDGNTMRPEGQQNVPAMPEEQDGNTMRPEGQQNTAAMPEEQDGNVTRPGGQQNTAAVPEEQDGNVTRPGGQQNPTTPPNTDETILPPQMEGEMMGMNKGLGNMDEQSSSGGSLEYTDDNIESYSSIFGNVVGKGTDSDFQRVIEALKALSEGEELETYFDVDQILRYLAAHTIVVNLDSYSSNMAQNYYIYERDGQITILPWDYNLAWGGFQNNSVSSVINFPIDTPLSGVEMSSRPLIEKLFANDEYLERYHSYLQQLIDNYFANGKFEEKINALDTLISDYVKNDPTAFCTYDEYEKAVSTFIELGNLRAQSVQGQLDGTIPSTTEEQNKYPEKLITSNSTNLSDLGGTMGGGNDRGGGPGKMMGQNNRPRNFSDTIEPTSNKIGANNLILFGGLSITLIIALVFVAKFRRNY